MRLLLTLLIVSVTAVHADDGDRRAPTSSTVTSLDTTIARQLPNGKARVTQLALGKNAFMGQLWLAPSAVVPKHKDQSEEYLYILSGHGTITIDGRRFKLKKGQTVYMPADAEVSFINGDEPLIAIQVFAGPESAAKYKKWIESSSTSAQSPKSPN